MLYTHFFAAFATVFFCFIGTISAQKDIQTLTQEEFEQLVENDAPKVYQWALDGKLNFEQLRFFSFYEGSNERNIQYLDTLDKIYWRQSTHKDKLNYEHFIYMDSHFPHVELLGEQYKFTNSFAYVLSHQAEFKKSWGDSVYNQYILKKLDIYCPDAALDPYAEELEPLATRIAKAEKYLALIKANLPDYEPQTRSSLYFQCVYSVKNEPEEYYNAADDFLMKYETQSDNFHTYTFDLSVRAGDLKYQKLGLKWINKAIELDNAPRDIICKAELLYQMGRIDEAKKTLVSVKERANSGEFWLAGYYQRVEKLIEKAK